MTTVRYNPENNSIVIEGVSVFHNRSLTASNEGDIVIISEEGIEKCCMHYSEFERDNGAPFGNTASETVTNLNSFFNHPESDFLLHLGM